MICPNCGTQIPDNMNFCGNCGYQFFPQNHPYGQQYPQQGMVVPPVQQQMQAPPSPVYQQPLFIQQTVVADGSSIGAFILGLLIPIFITFFFWLSWHDQQPLKTRSLLFGALTHFLVFNLPGILFLIWANT